MRWLILLSVSISLGAEFRTANFHVKAPDANAAELIGKWAEHYRRVKAVEWLGKEMPQWSNRCPLRVEVTMGQPNGMTSFNYLGNEVVSMEMSMSGSLDQMVYSVLPHEVTHTVFAHFFRCAVPRWADEGGAVLSEDAKEQERHARMVRKFLDSQKLFRLRALMQMSEYPGSSDGIMVLYCQGFGLTDFLVKQRDRATFLNFVAETIRTKDLDRAVQSWYGLKGIDDLEEAWLKSLQPSAPVRNLPIGGVARSAEKAPVQLKVRVPDANAQVWFDGKLTTSTGTERVYLTSPLEKGHDYAYTVRVAWNRAGEQIVREHQVYVTAGLSRTIDFSTGDIR